MFLLRSFRVLGYAVVAVVVSGAGGGGSDECNSDSVRITDNGTFEMGRDGDSVVGVWR